MSYEKPEAAAKGVNGQVRDLTEFSKDQKEDLYFLQRNVGSLKISTSI